MEAIRNYLSSARGQTFALCAVAALVALPVSARGQGEGEGAGFGETPELVTDRPDQTESAETVSPGRVQVETGLLRSEDDAGGVETETDELLGTLVRVGLVGDWELRLGWGGFVDAPGTDGAADAELGVKWRLARSASGRTTTALLASTSVPVGDDELTSDRFDPEVRLSVAHELSARLGFGWNVGVARESAPNASGSLRSESFLLATAALGFAASERVGLFVELFGEGGGSRGGSPAISLDGGATFLLRDNVQLDLAAGVGLSHAAADRFVGVGVSFRLPG